MIPRSLTNLQHGGTDAGVLRDGRRVLLGIEHRTVVILVQDSDEDVSLGGPRRVSTILGLDLQRVVGSGLSVQAAGHPQETVDGPQREHSGHRWVRTERVLYVAVPAFVFVQRLDCQHHGIDGDVLQD